MSTIKHGENTQNVKGRDGRSNTVLLHPCTYSQHSLSHAKGPFTEELPTSPKNCPWPKGAASLGSGHSSSP